MTAPVSKYMLTIRSSPDQLRVVDEWTERIAREIGFSESAISDLAICVTEAVNNAIVHAHRHDARKVIVIHFERETDGLRVRVLDEGRGFSFEGLPDPTLPENLLKDSGRGVHVMRHLMDRVEIRAHEQGTEVVMFKLKVEETS